MSCDKCGKILNDNASFCGACGSKQHTETQHNKQNDDKHNNNKINDDFSNIIITPAKKAELIQFSKKVGLFCGTLAVILIIFPIIFNSFSNKDFNTKNNILIEYQGSDASVNIPKNITEIGHWSFADKRFIHTITLSDSITKINTGAFEGCSSLKMITIPENVTEIGDWILAECWSLTTIRVKPGSYADAWARSYNFHSNINIEYF